MIINLLNNAYDAVRSAPTRTIRIVVEPVGGRARIVVEDSGPPIPHEVALEMFRAFFTTKSATDGTGLGLSISKEIIERHGGTIALDPGAAMTRFVVEIPEVRA